jgi:4-hydroxy-tetrahydrodipicolinate synthase
MRMISSRRQFLAAGASMPLALKFAYSAPGQRRLEGIFPIMQTPFSDSGALDTETLAREVKFLHRIGVQGMVWPQFASEYASLSFDERITGAETLARTHKALDAGRRPALVIGVQASDTATAVKYAQHAQTLQPDAIVAIPLNGGKDNAVQMEYYAAIGEACNRPLFVQSIGDMSVDLILDMARRIPTLRYVKDEAGVTLARLSEYRKRSGDLINAVFTGAHGKTLLDELARGSAGTMPAAGFADLYVAAWRDWKNGQRDAAMDMFAKTLLLISDAQAYGIAGLKYVLQLRGVFPNSKCRGAERASLFDEEAQEAIRRTVDYAKRWFKA